MSSKTSALTFKQGFADGIPIGLGYFSVSFGFGVMAVSKGITALAAMIMSLTNLTSAGQVAGITIIAAGGTLAEMALAQLIINMRYALMSLSLSQKLDSTFTLPHRIITSFAITDEIFAVASSHKDISKNYMYGIMMPPILCWTSGTILGGIAGEILPERIKGALGIAIFGMFIAIFIPPARKSVGVLCVVILSAVLSCCLEYIPLFSVVSDGFAIIICTLVAALAGAIFFPVKDSDSEVQSE